MSTLSMGATIAGFGFEWAQVDFICFCIKLNVLGLDFAIFSQIEK